MNRSLVPCLLLLAFTTASPAEEQDGAGLLYGRVTTTDGETLTGRLRFGGTDEAFWSHYFIGRKAANRWAGHVPTATMTQRKPVSMFGVALGSRAQEPELRRPLLIAFGQIRRVDADGRSLTVTLKNGTQHPLDRYEADDFADGLRVWTTPNTPLDLDEWSIRSIEFLPTPTLDGAPARLTGSVHTRLGRYSGALRWDRTASATSDVFEGIGESTPIGDVSRIDKTESGSMQVTLRTGRQIIGEPGAGHRGVDVDEPGLGLVSIPWGLVEAVVFDPAEPGLPYTRFTPGRPLRGRVTTDQGDHHAGRLVFDLDESQSTDVLDASAGPLQYRIPFSLIREIERGAPATDGAYRLDLFSGRELRLEARGDLAPENAGMLVFSAEGEPVYLAFSSIAHIRFDLLD